MKKLKTITFVLAVCTALVLLAGFTSSRAPALSTGKHPVFEEERKNMRPVADYCYDFINGKWYQVGFSIYCIEFENAACVATKPCPIPGTQSQKDMRVVLFRCRNAENKVVSAAAGCATATDSYCIEGACPPGTSASTL